MTIDTKVVYDFDVVVFDTVGGAYTSESMAKASGGSEKEIVQLAEALVKRGFNVGCFNKTRDDESHDHRMNGGGVLTWAHLDEAKAARCKMLIVQRYSQLPNPTQVLPDRMVVRATDVYGNYYDHLSALHHLCVSEWQAQKFREAGFADVSVIPAMLDDDYYELASTPKVKGRFIYASAAMKGLRETLTKWRQLYNRFPAEMNGTSLHVTSPGYGKIGVDPEHEHPSVRFIADLPPRDLAKYMATCEGLFYVNTFPETFCAVAAIADAVGCTVHVLCKNGASGIPEAVVAGVTETEGVFDTYFIRSLKASPRDLGPLDDGGPKDFRVSTVMPQWLDALHLNDAAPGGVAGGHFPAAPWEPPWPAKLSDTPPLRSPHDMTDEEKSRLVGDAARKLNVKFLEAHESLAPIVERMRANLTPKERSILDKRVGFSAEAAIDAAAREIGARGTVAHNDLARRAQQAALSKTVRGDVDARFVRLPEVLDGLRSFPTWNNDQKRHWDAMSPRNKRRWLDKHSTAKTEKKNVNDKTQTVCLVMLAKGAETTIRRALESVAHFVDFVVFQFDDAESSVAMRDIIEDVFNGTSVDYVVQYEPWINFSINRNKLLAAAREMAPQADFQLTLDADDQFVNLNSFDKSKLDADFYEVDIVDGGKAYSRLMLWRADSGARYEGPAHEFVTSDLPGKITKALGDGVHYIRHGMTLSIEQTRAKYLRDVELFVLELRKNPADTRSAYYLAQSLEDAACGDERMLESALKMYLQRAKMEGFRDEKFLAWMKVGALQKHFKQYSVMVDSFLAATKVIPERSAEALYEMMLYWNNEGDNKVRALACGDVLGASGLEMPRGFLVDVDVYTWKFEFQYAIALFYTGQKERAKKIWELLLTPGKAPDYEHGVIRQNLAFCNPEVKVETDFLGELETRFVKPADIAKPIEDRGAVVERAIARRPTPGFPPKSFPDPPAIDRAIIYARETGNHEAAKHLVRLQTRSMAWGAGYGTHLPLLGAVMAKSSGGVLELGAGNFSTPYLSAVCRATDRKLITVEEASEWFYNVEDVVQEHRAVPTPYDWIATIDKAIDDLRVRYGADVCFMDHGRTNVDRIAALQHLKERDVFDFIVVHDTRNSWFAGVDDCLDTFAFRYDYCLMTPVTTVVSNKHDVGKMFGR